MQMAGVGVKQAYAMFNGQKILATYDEATDKYAIECNAPSESSWGQPGHIFPMSLHAEDNAGNTVEMLSDDPTYGSQLRFRVLEKTVPVATIVSPTANSVLGNSNITVKLKVKDYGDSGVNLTSAVFKVDNTETEIGEWASDTEDEGAFIANVFLSSLADGAHTLSLKVTDNDGNDSVESITTFIISTAAPSLTVTKPDEGLITNSTTVLVTGVAATGSSYTTLAGVTVNSESVALSEDGSFSHEVTLAEGTSTITVTVTDSIGKATTVTRTVTVDLTAPIISEVVAEAVTVDASGRIRVTFKVTDAPR